MHPKRRSYGRSARSAQGTPKKIQFKQGSELLGVPGGKMEDRSNSWAILEKDFEEYVADYCKTTNQETLFRARVKVTTAKDPGLVKDRVLVITSFELLTIKKALMGKSIRQQLSLLDLSGFYIITKSDKKTITVRIKFPEDSVDLETKVGSEMACALARSVLSVWKSISYGVPAGQQPVFSIPQMYLKEFTEPKPDVCDGILASYLASCNRKGISSLPQVLEYFMESFNAKNTQFDLGECIGYKEVNKKNVYNKCSPVQLLQVAAGLRYTNFYHELVCIDYPMLDDGLTGFADMFKRNSVTRTAIVKAGIKSQGAGSLGKILSLGQHNLQFLNLSKNLIGDSGLRAVVNGLDKGKRVVPTLCFQNCGITPNGVQVLTDLICKPQWAKEMIALDVSDNRLRKNGSIHLAKWLSQTTAKTVHMKNCELDMEKIFVAILDNSYCDLSTLDISGNKIDRVSKEQLLHKLLAETKTLKILSLKKVYMHKTLLPGLFKSVFENKTNLDMVLDISDCGIGESGSKSIMEVFLKYKKSAGKSDRKGYRTNISTLNLNDNGFGIKGVENIIDALVGTDIQHMYLDRNYTKGFFSSTKTIAGALTRCIKEWPALRTLSFEGGDGNHLSKLAYPFLESLADNRSLTMLNLASNKLGDEGIKILSDSLKKNTSLTSINIDRNKISMSGLCDLEDMCLENTSLTDWVVPMDDITKILRSFPEKAEELTEILGSFENSMDNNAERRNKSTRDALVTELATSVNQMTSWHEQVVTRKRKDTRIIGGMKSTLRLKNIIAGQTLDAKKLAAQGRSETKEDKEAREMLQQLAAKEKKPSRGQLPSGWGFDEGDGSDSQKKSTPSIG